jgi:hypothetical protein
VRHPRFHLHFIPTGSSWLNLVERWFAEITMKLIRRGVHRSVADLKTTSNNGPSTGTTIHARTCGSKTADQILESLSAYCQRISDSEH